MCVFVCVCDVYVCACVHICIHTHAHIHTYAHARARAHTHTHTPLNTGERTRVQPQQSSARHDGTDAGRSAAAHFCYSSLFAGLGGERDGIAYSLVQHLLQTIRRLLHPRNGAGIPAGKTSRVGIYWG